MGGQGAWPSSSKKLFVGGPRGLSKKAKSLSTYFVKGGREHSSDLMIERAL